MSVMYCVVAGLCAVLAMPVSVALLKASGRMEMSVRSLVGWLMFLTCAWCLGHAIEGKSSGPEALMMALAAYQALSALNSRRMLRRASDLSPFK